jgi:acyl-coenzyme A synthetase/AMP-(fatty) acid ligase
MTADWLGKVAVQIAEPADLARLDQAIPGERIVRLCRTSGTTGAPKLVAMSHATQQVNVARFAQSMLDDPAQRPCFLCLYNLTLRSAYYRVLGVLQRGGTVHFAQETTAPGLIESGAVNTTMLMVGDLQRLVQVTRPPPPGHVLQIETVGAAVSKRLRRQIGERLNARFTSYYSSVETGRIALIGEDDIGTLCAGVTVRIVDEQGRDNPLGEPGLICARTETMVAGYLDDPMPSDRVPADRVPTDPGPIASVFADGWFRTNDMGRLSAPDRLILLGRADDMLNVGGVKIPPAPIEAQIRTIAGVADAVLVVVDGPGEVAVLLAAVETANGVVPPGLTERLDPILAPYLRSFALLVLPGLPRTENGKVRRQDVAALYARARNESRPG